MTGVRMYQKRPSGTWWATASDGHEYQIKPCVEHNGALPCYRHLGDPIMSHFELHLSRVLAGVVAISLVTVGFLLIREGIEKFGMWLLYWPLIAFFAACALYVIGWAVMVCSRLGQKSPTD